MKLTTFNYTDTKGKDSYREVLVMKHPTDKISGVDVSESTEEDIAKFAVEYDFLYSEFLGKVEELKEKYDLKHNYRQFFEQKMRDVKVEFI